MSRTEVLRIAAVGDLHCSKTSQGEFQPLFKLATQNADVLLLCGDLTDYGTPAEAHVLLKELSTPNKIPIIAVLGNHDFETGNQIQIKQIFSDGGVIVLDGESCEIKGVGFAGVKGFGGGFGKSVLNPWGEEAVKTFVNEAVTEALKLESALARLHTPERVAILHYSPIQETVEGERREVFPFLGSSRLEEPLNRHSVTVAFHGHVHYGQLAGKTSGGIPIYNVALALLRTRLPENPPFRLYELNLTQNALSDDPHLATEHRQESDHGPSTFAEHNPKAKAVTS